MSQVMYVLNMLERVGVPVCKLGSTSCVPKLECFTRKGDKGCGVVFLYIHKVIYGMTCIRPDITWIVGKLS